MNILLILIVVICIMAVVITVEYSIIKARGTKIRDLENDIEILKRSHKRELSRTKFEVRQDALAERVNDMSKLESEIAKVEQIGVMTNGKDTDNYVAVTR